MSQTGSSPHGGSPDLVEPPVSDEAGARSDAAEVAGSEPERGTRILIGAYTPEMGGTATGLISLRWTRSDADQIDIVAHEPVPLASPTWVEAHPAGGLVFACTETDPGALAVLRIDGDGALTPVRAVETGGGAGCHLGLSPDGRIIVMANYGDGSVATFSAVDDDTLGDRLDGHVFDTSGPDAERQDHAHAHQVVFDGATVLVPDLGGDVIHRLAVDDAGRITVAAEPVRLPPGSGPRHLVVTGDHLAVACELSAQVWLARRDGSGWREVAVVPSTGRAADPENRVYPSGIAVHEGLIVVANRGCDTFATFALDPGADALTLLDEQDTVGAWPRDLGIVDGRLWIATQVGNAIASYLPDVDDTGRPTGGWVKDLEFESPSPARVAIVAPAPTTRPVQETR